ncbi:MAG: hypothetical protein OEV78_04430 [Spirochaetia bacterium]|nr:hypothetical protein [Spirochaetia bacterium]
MKKIFYNKRHKVPVWSQIYLAWLVVFVIGLVWILNVEIISVGSEIKKSYNYNKEYNKISDIHFNILKNYPNATEYNHDLINKLNTSLGKNNWKLDEVNQELHKLKCRVVRYKIENEKPDLIVLFDHDHITNMFYFLHIFVSAMIYENLHHVAAVSVQGGPLCVELAVNNFEKNAEGKTGYLHVFTEANKNPVLKIINSAGSFSSIHWSAITPDSISRPTFLEQLIQGAVPLFQKSIYSKNSISTDGIGWAFSSDIKNNVNLIHSILPPLLYTVRNYDHIKTRTISSLFWIGDHTALSKRGSIILSFLFVLLIWLPIANRLYLGESIQFIARAFFGVLYSSISFLAMALLVKTFGLFIPVSIYGISVVFVLFVIMAWFLNKMQKTVLNFNVNSLTEFLAFTVFSSILAFTNQSLFILSIPLIFIASKKEAIGFSGFRFLLILSLSPLVYAFFISASLLSLPDLTKQLSLVWLNHLITYDIKSASTYFLWAGSFFLILRRPK